MSKSMYFALAALSVAAGSAPAQNASNGPDLPITRIVMFSSGVGYYQRDGLVNGQATVTLHFPVEQINDLLKSLIAQDRGNGQVSLVNYDNRNPIERTLKTFALDLTGDPSLGQLLTQARGERVRVTVPGENRGEPIAATIVGVEKHKQTVGKDQIVEIEHLNLLTENGLVNRPLSRIERIEFVKPSLNQDFRKALEALASGRDRQKKTVAVHFSGAGKRPVSLGYLVESPVWKTSYRLALDQGKPFLQGWAVVENTTDEDWNNVRVGLVAGRPISFRMDLYEPLFVPRPLVELERYAGLVPQRYEGETGVKTFTAVSSTVGNVPPGGIMSPVPPPAEKQSATARPSAAFGIGRKDEAKGEDQLAVKALNLPLNIAKSTGGAATAELGEFFQYEIKEPVSLPRQKSALLPILNQSVEGKRVSIYNEHVQVKHPLLGLSLKNTSGLHLMQGPITVLEESSYAGDALLPDLRPGEERLISYAVDLGVEVVPAHDPKKPSTEDLVSVQITHGILHATYKQRQTRVYTVANRTEQQRHVIVEHPRQPGWELVLRKEQKPKETRDAYRFDVTVGPGKSAKEEVVTEHKRLDKVVLLTSPDETLRYFLAQSISEKLKQALTKALALKTTWSETLRTLGQEKEAIATIEKNQARMRETLKVLEKTSDLYKRYIKRFEEQETELDQRQARVTQLQAEAEQQRRAYESFLAKLEVE